MKRTMSKSEQTADMKVYSWVSRFITSFLLITVLLLGGATQSLRATQVGKPQVRNEPPQQTVQSVVAKQASLVSEFEVNGLKVLMKRREGSLTVSAGLFVRGGASKYQRVKCRHRIADVIGLDGGHYRFSARENAERVVADGHSNRK
jgi:hypothetical protein